MHGESRAKKTLLNAKVNLLCYLFSLVTAFFTRGVLLECLGTEFIGLTGTLQSLLGFLNLAELGVGSAIGYALYKPLADSDRVKINELISVFGYIYRCIGGFIIIVACVLSFFIPLIFSNSSFSTGLLLFGFYTYLGSAILGYFVNYKQTLLFADQKNYIITGYFQFTTILKIIMQMILALTYKSFVIYFVIEIFFGIINSIILNYQIKRTYPWLADDVRLGRKLLVKYPEIGRYVKQLFVHKIGGFVQYQISPLLIYSFVSLPVVALYSNYTLITQKVQSLFGTLTSSLGAGIGSVISEGDPAKIYRIYQELFAVQTLLVGLIINSVYFLINPFISLWLGSEYALDNLFVFLLSVHFGMELFRGVTDNFKFGFGLFSDVWAPVAESLIFIIAASLGGYFFQLKGILFGPIFSLFIIAYIWKPYYLYKKGFQLPFKKYIGLFLKYMVIICCSFLISKYLYLLYFTELSLKSTWNDLILGGLTFASLNFVSLFLFIYMVSQEFRDFVRYRVKTIIK